MSGTELAKRAVACKGWRWMPGMLVGGPSIVPPARITEVSDSGDDINARGWWSRSKWDAYAPLPDLDDPATVGCLLALVREVWGDPYASTFGVYANWGVASRSGHTLSVGYEHDTEADALVSALEDAP